LQRKVLRGQPNLRENPFFSEHRGGLGSDKRISVCVIAVSENIWLLEKSSSIGVLSVGAES